MAVKVGDVADALRPLLKRRLSDESEEVEAGVMGRHTALARTCLQL